MLTKGGHRHLDAGFQGGGLELRGGRRPLDRGLGLHDLEFHGGRQFQADRLALVEDDLRLAALLHVEHLVADPFPVQGDLVVRLGVHEDVAVAVLVDVVHLPLVQVSLLDLVLGADPVHGDGAGLEILQLQLQDGPPVAGGVQIPVNHGVELAVVADDDHSLADLTVFDRSHRLPPSCKRAPARGTQSVGNDCKSSKKGRE